MPLSYPTAPVAADLTAALVAAGFSATGLTDLINVAAPAGVAAFEAETGRKWSAATETRVYDFPRGENGVVLLDKELASLTSLSIGGQVQVQNTSFWLLPENGPVYGQVRLAPSGLFPLTSIYGAVSIVGTWGNANVPADAWLAMVWLGLGELLPLVLASAQAAGTSPLTEWGEGGVTEKYTDFQTALTTYTQAQFDRTVKRYQRWLPG